MIDELYAKASNNMISDRILDLIIDCEGDSYLIYDGIIRMNDLKNPDRNFNKSVRDRLFCEKTIEWRNSIVFASNEEINQYCKAKNININEYNMVKDYLCYAKKPVNYDEVYKLLNPDDINLRNSIKKMSYNILSGWNYFASRYFDLNKTPPFEIKHRLYLNIDPSMVDEVVYLILSAAKNNNIPYELKYSFSYRNDSLVIYCSDENLSFYVNTLRTIKLLRPQLNKHVGKPSVLCLPIDDWIGYGDEPIYVHDSFNNVRAKAFEDGYNHLFKNWLLDYISNNYKKDDLTRRIVNTGINSAIKEYESLIDKSKNSTDINKYKDILNYIKSENFRKTYIHYINYYFFGYVNPMIGFTILQSLNYKTPNGNHFSIHNNIFHIIVEQFTTNLKTDSNFRDRLKISINKALLANGIDYTKIAFDLSTIVNLKNQNINRIISSRKYAQEIALDNFIEELREVSILLINGSNLNDKYVKERISKALLYKRAIFKINKEDEPEFLIEKKRAAREVHSIFNTGDYSKCLEAIDTYMKLSSLKQR